MKNLWLFSIGLFLFYSCTVTKDIEVSKVQGNLVGGRNVILYSLPRTALEVTFEVTQHIFIKGPYAEYARKYLALSSVSMMNKETWDISGIKTRTIHEPDPGQVYSVSFKTYPSNLNALWSVSGKGILLDMANSWTRSFHQSFPGTDGTDEVFNSNILRKPEKEIVDTIFRTVITDSSFTKVPVYKKQILPKTTEDLAKEAAHEILKTRKRKMKIIRGEYDFHPDGAALKIMLAEMDQIEKQYLELFTGKNITRAFQYHFTVYPQPNLQPVELGYFSKEKGWLEQPGEGAEMIKAGFSKDGPLAAGVSPGVGDNTKNQLFFRVPQNLNVLIFGGNRKIYTANLPFYQFGEIQRLPLREK